MNAHDEERITQLLKDSLPPISDAGPQRDLWPYLLQRLCAQPTAPPWFDWALAGGLAVFSVALPATIPVLLYYL
ncbi:MAG TPA: hypothetical protein VHW46_10930 [Terracidiphilus sp.]|jgi:hypothetical protein|nr:hypothetical protein [Terracidiphilus sp.]